MRRLYAPAILASAWLVSMASAQAPVPPTPTPTPAPAPAPTPTPPTPPTPNLPPKLVAPDKADPYRLVMVRVEGVYDSAAIIVEPDDLADVRPDDDGKGATFVGPPGKYIVRAVTLDGKQLRWLRAVVTIVDPNPPPAPPPVPPGPGPTPPPGPTPSPTPVVAGHLYATYIADSRAVLPSHAAMKRPKGLLTEFKGLDASWRWYQSDESELAASKLLAHATTLPAVVIQDKSGKVIDVLNAPSEADVIAAVKKWRAAK